LDVYPSYYQKAGKVFALLKAKNSTVFLGCPILKGSVELIDKGQVAFFSLFKKGQKLAAYAAGEK
jgi:hypothetical protein